MTAEDLARKYVLKMTEDDWLENCTSSKMSEVSLNLSKDIRKYHQSQLQALKDSLNTLTCIKHTDGSEYLDAEEVEHLITNLEDK